MAPESEKCLSIRGGPNTLTWALGYANYLADPVAPDHDFVVPFDVFDGVIWCGKLLIRIVGIIPRGSINDYNSKFRSYRVDAFEGKLTGIRFPGILPDSEEEFMASQRLEKLGFRESEDGDLDPSVSGCYTPIERIGWIRCGCWLGMLTNLNDLDLQTLFLAGLEKKNRRSRTGRFK